MLTSKPTIGSEQTFIATRSAFGEWDFARPQIHGARGAWLTDDSGRTWLDFASGSGSLILGHADAQCIAVLAAQASQVSLYPGQLFRCAVVEDYLRMLTGFVGGELTRALTASSGSDAVEAAMKLAIQHHQARGDPHRNRIVGRAGSYHGNSLFGLSVGGHLQRRAPYESALPLVPRAAAAFCYRCQFDQTPDKCTVQCADSLESAIVAAGPDSIAAVIVEPIVGAALSAAVPDERYLSRVRQTCDRHGILLIFDEVLTGFGRTGRPFAFQHWGVSPDMVVLGKAISAGYFPLSAVVATERVVEPLRAAGCYFENGQTHQFNPVGAAVGKHVIERIRAEGLAERAATLGESLLDRLEVLRRFDCIGDIRGKGLMLGIELVRRRDVKQRFEKHSAVARRFADAALRAGLVVYPCTGGPESSAGDHVLLLPPLTLREEEMEHAVAALVSSAEELQRACCSRAAPD